MFCKWCWFDPRTSQASKLVVDISVPTSEHLASQEPSDSQSEIQCCSKTFGLKTFGFCQKLSAFLKKSFLGYDQKLSAFFLVATKITNFWSFPYKNSTQVHTNLVNSIYTGFIESNKGLFGLFWRILSIFGLFGIRFWVK